jgi:hypothetical protein
MFSVFNSVGLNENPVETTELTDQNNHQELSITTNRVINGNLEFETSYSLFGATKYAGPRYEKAVAVAVDSEDNIYVGGWDEGYPWSGYLSKLKPNSELEWTYYLENSVVSGIVVDSNDNIIITGATRNTNLPTTPNAFDNAYNSPSPLSGVFDGDLYLAKFNSSGNIIWCSYLGSVGGETFEIGAGENGYFVGIAVDSQDNIVVVDKSMDSNFPIKDAIQEEKSSGFDAIICKFNPMGELLWSTFLGDTGYDAAQSVSFDQDDNIYIAGKTNSSGFPVTSGAYDEMYNGEFDIFLTKLNPQGRMVWGTFVGGNEYELYGNAVVDQENNVYLLFNSFSSDFPADNEYNGNWDIVICKFTQLGKKVWSKFIGGSEADTHGYSVRNMRMKISTAIDHNGNIIITSGTQSEDFPVKNAEFEEYSGAFGPFAAWDGFLISISPSGDLLWSTYFGGTGNEWGIDVAVDHQNRIIMGGFIRGISVSDPYGKFPLVNAFPYSFDFDRDGYISKWENNGSLLWSTAVSVIPYPDADNDGDSLTNYEEYKLCYETSLVICTNPLDSDTDADGLNDDYELDIGINPALQDSDGDAVFDGYEIILGLLPNNTDTDGDQMDDHWELNYMLNGTYADDVNQDPDGDGLTNLQEFQDGLTNFEEYDYEGKLDPFNSDTDGDGMPDGWEVKYGLDPKNSDGFEDADGDGLDNRSEYQLRRLGFKPNNELDVIIAIIGVITAIVSIVAFIFWRRKRNANAILMGYESYPDYKSSIKQGFISAKERNKAFSSGFLTKQVQNAINSTGYQTVTEMITDWDDIMTRVAEEIPAHQVTKQEQLISETTSPLNLEEVKHKLDPFVKKLNQEVDQLRQIISLQQLLITLQEKSKMALLADLAKEDLNGYLTKFLTQVNELDQHHINISNTITQREVWFDPWKALLTLIQITEDGMPISLDRIAEVVSCSEDQAADLVKLLLSENKHIGKYDDQEKVYTKGVNIKDYIQMILSQLEDIEED